MAEILKMKMWAYCVWLAIFSGANLGCAVGEGRFISVKTGDVPDAQVDGNQIREIKGLVHVDDDVRKNFNRLINDNQKLIDLCVLTFFLNLPDFRKEIDELYEQIEPYAELAFDRLNDEIKKNTKAKKRLDEFQNSNLLSGSGSPFETLVKEHLGKGIWGKLGGKKLSAVLKQELITIVENEWPWLGDTYKEKINRFVDTFNEQCPIFDPQLKWFKKLYVIGNPHVHDLVFKKWKIKKMGELPFNKAGLDQEKRSRATYYKDAKIGQTKIGGFFAYLSIDKNLKTDEIKNTYIVPLNKAITGKENFSDDIIYKKLNNKDSIHVYKKLNDDKKSDFRDFIEKHLDELRQENGQYQDTGLPKKTWQLYGFFTDQYNKVQYDKPEEFVAGPLEQFAPDKKTVAMQKDVINISAFLNNRWRNVLGLKKIDFVSKRKKPWGVAKTAGTIGLGVAGIGAALYGLHKKYPGQSAKVRNALGRGISWVRTRRKK